MKLKYSQVPYTPTWRRIYRKDLTEGQKGYYDSKEQYPYVTVKGGELLLVERKLGKPKERSACNCWSCTNGKLWILE